MKHRNVINLTAWVTPSIFSEWNKYRLSESPSPSSPTGWSEWLKSKVTTALNISQIPSPTTTNPYTLQAILHNKQIEIDKLTKRISELETREIGVSDDRIINCLHDDEFILFDTIVQTLIDNEPENVYSTLQKLAINGIIESDTSGNKWRIKR